MRKRRTLGLLAAAWLRAATGIRRLSSNCSPETRLPATLLRVFDRAGCLRNSVNAAFSRRERITAENIIHREPVGVPRGIWPSLHACLQ